MKIVPSLFLAVVVLMQADVFAVTHMEASELLDQADLVAIGFIISVDQGVDTTRAQVQLLQVIKGRGEVAGGLVSIESGSGKVYIDESQPNFMVRHTDLLFLHKTEEGYVCVNQADGQKSIHGENVYPYHDNAAYGVPLKDYLKSMEVAMKALVNTS